VGCFVVMFGPAIRSYGGLPALRADTWVCPYCQRCHHTTAIGSILDGLYLYIRVLNHGFFMDSTDFFLERFAVGFVY